MFVHQRHAIMNTKGTLHLSDVLLRVCTNMLSINSSPHCVIIANRNTPTTMRCFQWSYHFATLSLAFHYFCCIVSLCCFKYLFKAFVFQIFPFSEYNLMYRQSSRLSASDRADKNQNVYKANLSEKQSNRPLQDSCSDRSICW